MATIGELYALSKAYPIVSIVIAVILFFIGLRVVPKLIRWVLWIIAAIAVVAALYMLFA